jgi:hypothetical protein
MSIMRGNYLRLERRGKTKRWWFVEYDPAGHMPVDDSGRGYPSRAKAVVAGCVHLGSSEARIFDLHNGEVKPSREVRPAPRASSPTPRGRPADRPSARSAAEADGTEMSYQSIVAAEAGLLHYFKQENGSGNDTDVINGVDPRQDGRGQRHHSGSAGNGSAGRDSAARPAGRSAGRPRGRYTNNGSGTPTSPRR